MVKVHSYVCQYVSGKVSRACVRVGGFTRVGSGCVIVETQQVLRYKLRDVDPTTTTTTAQVTSVFGYQRNLHDKYHIGRVIGAGSFGVVRECVEVASQRVYAVKTVPKVGQPLATNVARCGGYLSCSYAWQLLRA